MENLLPSAHLVMKSFYRALNVPCPTGESPSPIGQESVPPSPAFPPSGSFLPVLSPSLFLFFISHICD